MSRTLKYLALLLCGGSSLWAQHLGFGFDIGAKGGIPFTDQLEVNVQNSIIQTLDRSSEYLIGPVAELRLPLGLAVELDALYRHANYRDAVTTAGAASASAITAGSWEIPYLAKYRPPFPLLKPFLSAGGAYRSLDGKGNFTVTNNAFVLGGGLEFKLSRLRFSGELRWLHWQSDASQASQPSIRLTRNQGELLFGATF